MGADIDPHSRDVTPRFHIRHGEGDVLVLVVIQVEGTEVCVDTRLSRRKPVFGAVTVDFTRPDAEAFLFDVGEWIDVIQREQRRLIGRADTGSGGTQQGGLGHLDPLGHTDSFADPHACGIHKAEGGVEGV